MPTTGSIQTRHLNQPMTGRSYPDIPPALLTDGMQLYEYATKLAGIAPYTSANKWLLWVANQGFAANKDKEKANTPSTVSTVAVSEEATVDLVHVTE